MDKETRNRIQRATQDARRLLETEFGEQLEGIFDILSDGTIAEQPGSHLNAPERLVREKLVAAIEHIRAGGAKPAESVETYLREASFTTLNRFVALKMLEARGLVQECISKGDQSAGFKEFCGLAPGLVTLPDHGYRLYIESLFDEIGREVGILFDRRDPASLLWPRRQALQDLLGVLNRDEIAEVWAEDETIGWVYQYFNSQEERRRMRDESQAPRNSHELAVRNQFFTPRYVVEFLTDNTLGRIWYEMRKGNTRLKEQCKYLVRRPTEIFLKEGEAQPTTDNGQPATDNLSQEELLKQPVYIPHRPKKDPREIKILDPACGSGHFLLYCFDLLQAIYEEAWGDDTLPLPQEENRRQGMKALREDYPTLDSLRLAAPGLILRHNLHGIDIDPRCAQIAAFSLWMRCQRAYNELKVSRDERPPIHKTNIVVAEPMPGEKDLLKEFTSRLDPPLLGQLVDKVFDKMRLAGEAGSLLKIEEELREDIVKARKQWLDRPRAEQLSLFPDLERPQAEQLRFDFSGITHERFWEQAEQWIYEALKDYAHSVTNGESLQRRLFAEDATRGFAFIDLCRKRYDVVLMNPPFGEFSKPYKTYGRIVYPNSYNDILGAFVERWLLCLEDHGRLGAITSRTCFYLVSFTDWREKVILAEAALAAVADLGQGVMDDAMVEAAAYILERSRPTVVIPFIRSIAERDRQAVVGCCISAINTAASEPHLFLARQDTFRKLAGAPFVYWTKSDDLDRFAALPTFEPEAAEVRQGLATGDDPRFVRAVWEVAEKDTQFVYYPTNGYPYCRLDDPIVLAYQRRRKAGTPRWAFHVKSGASQPWYSPITLKIYWHNDGSQLRNFRDAQGKLRSRPQNIAYYYRPGFSWTRRAARFYPYVIPGSCIPSVSRYMAFPEHGREYDAIGVSASRIASAFMRFFGEKFEWPNFLVENLKALPWPELTEDIRRFFRGLMQQEVEQRQRAYMNHEPFHEFLLPIMVWDFSNGGRSLAFDPKTLLGEEGERLVAKAYGFDQAAAIRIERDVVEALEFQHGVTVSAEDAEGENGERDTDENTDFVLDYSEQAQVEALLSYFVGCICSRWDVRIAIDPSLAPKLPNPFDPLPVCPPGMLIGPDGLPAEPNHIVSDEWLHARPDANTLPPDGSVKTPTIPDSEYPLRLSWDGVLVDDPGHTLDVEARIRRVLEIIWRNRAEAIAAEATEILGVSSLRDYFRKPNGFFADHIKRYSKSRRKAPIYWQLATPSTGYSVWLYYHRFTKDTFYKVQELVSSKLRHEERKLTGFRQEYGSTPTASQRKEIAEQEAFVDELRVFTEEVARITPLWNPDLNDGVIINFAPLWRLVPQHRSWQKECKKVWDELVKGDYDWAHLALHLWPERVIPKCATDRSLAIAHDLEDFFWEEDEDGKCQPKEVPEEEVEKLIAERTSPSVKAALNDLLKAPAPANGTRSKRRKRRVS